MFATGSSIGHSLEVEESRASMSSRTLVSMKRTLCVPCMSLQSGWSEHEGFELWKPVSQEGRGAALQPFSATPLGRSVFESWREMV